MLAPAVGVLYVPDVAPPARQQPHQMAAWRPAVPGVAEVFHAQFADHAYPLHTHDTWTLLIIDAGVVAYDLDRHEHGALPALVTLLPPHVAHDGRGHGFRKRVLYLEEGLLGSELVGAAVDHPGLPDLLLRHRIAQLHGVLARPGDEFEAEGRLALVRERLRAHFRPAARRARPDDGLAGRLRELLDAHVVDGLTLDAAAATLHAHPTHLIRAFTRVHGLPPHRYLTGRRVELARRLLLAGQPAAEVAAAAGFHDQSHLTRHFRRMLGTTPGRYRS